MTQSLSESALDQLFRRARTAHAFRPDPVPDLQPRGPRLAFDAVAQII